MLTAVKASCSVPVLCNPVELDGFHYMDGSLADSIPVKRAFEVGCDRVVCILTRKPEEAPTNYGKIRVLMRTYKKKYPAFYDTLMRRREMYAAPSKTPTLLTASFSFFESGVGILVFLSIMFSHFPWKSARNRWS